LAATGGVWARPGTPFSMTTAVKPALAAPEEQRAVREAEHVHEPETSVSPGATARQDKPVGGGAALALPCFDGCASVWD
jgi:hypothetical protein